MYYNNYNELFIEDIIILFIAKCSVYVNVYDTIVTRGVFHDHGVRQIHIFVFLDQSDVVLLPTRGAATSLNFKEKKETHN